MKQFHQHPKALLLVQSRLILFELTGFCHIPQMGRLSNLELVLLSTLRLRYRIFIFLATLPLIFVTITYWPGVNTSTKFVLKIQRDGVVVYFMS